MQSLPDWPSDTTQVFIWILWLFKARQIGRLTLPKGLYTLSGHSKLVRFAVWHYPSLYICFLAIQSLPDLPSDTTRPLYKPSGYSKLARFAVWHYSSLYISPLAFQNLSHWPSDTTQAFLYALWLSKLARLAVWHYPGLYIRLPGIQSLSDWPCDSIRAFIQPFCPFKPCQIGRLNLPRPLYRPSGILSLQDWPSTQAFILISPCSKLARITVWHYVSDITQAFTYAFRPFKAWQISRLTLPRPLYTASGHSKLARLTLYKPSGHSKLPVWHYPSLYISPLAIQNLPDWPCDTTQVFNKPSGHGSTYCMN